MPFKSGGTKNILHWTFYTITLKWLQWQIYNLYFAFEPSSRLEMAVTICIVIDFQRAKNSKYTITQRSRLLMGAWETFVSHTDALQTISLNVSQSNNVLSRKCTGVPFCLLHAVLVRHQWMQFYIALSQYGSTCNGDWLSISALGVNVTKEYVCELCSM